MSVDNNNVNGAFNNGDWVTASKAFPNKGLCFHVAFTWSSNITGMNGSTALYIDGVMVASKTFGMGGFVNLIQPFGGPIFIGGRPQNTFLNGSLDNVEIFTRTLSVDEIKTHRDGGLVNGNKLFGRYNFESDAGDEKIADACAAMHHGVYKMYNGTEMLANATFIVMCSNYTGNTTTPTTGAETTASTGSGTTGTTGSGTTGTGTTGSETTGTGTTGSGTTGTGTSTTGTSTTAASTTAASTTAASTTAASTTAASTTAASTTGSAKSTTGSAFALCVSVILMLVVLF